MNNSFNKKNIFIALTISTAFILSVIVIFLTQNSYGGGDSTQHYNLAHWGWKHPHLLFNHWGKPFFTILISPFAQFGMAGARIFNLIVGFATGFIIWKIAIELKLKNALLSLFFVIFTPIYFILIFTPLTEVLFSFFISLSVLFFFKRKYLLSAIILSFTPLIRNEGIVLFPLFIFAYLSKKKYLTLPMLLVGFLTISSLGYGYYDDFWWLISKMPYGGDAADIYGSGSLFHFINDTRGILGYPIGFLFLIGSIVLIAKWIKQDNYRLSNSFYFLLLITGSYIVFVAAHSFVWWQGIGNSLGLVRVVGSVSPFAALTSLVGFSFIIDRIVRYNKKAGVIFAILLLGWIFALGIGTHRFGFKLTVEQKLVEETSNYLIENNLENSKIYYFDPFVPFSLGIDPYDSEICQFGINDKTTPSKGLSTGDLIIWDAHFGPNEFRTPLVSMMNDKKLELIQTFKPAKPKVVLGGYDYEIYVFRKTEDSNTNFPVTLIFDYENTKSSSENMSHGGKYSLHVTEQMEYINFIDINLDDLHDSIVAFEIKVQGYINNENYNNEELPLVYSILKDNEIKYHNVFNIGSSLEPHIQWNKFEHTTTINDIPVDHILKIYIRNRHGLEFYIDDVEINISH